MRFDPSIAFDTNGNLFVAYGFEPVGSQVRRLVVARSGDGGDTFSDFFTVETAVGLDKFHLATGPSAPSSNIPAVYVAYSNVSISTSWPVRIAGLRFGVDTGFTAPVTISGAGSLTNNIFAQPAVGPNGELYVVWHSLGGTGVGRVVIDRDLNGLFVGGANFGNDITVRNLTYSLYFYLVPAQPRRGIHAGPTIAVDRSAGPFRGRVYVAFADRAAAPNNSDIFVSSSSNQGGSWTALGVTGNVESDPGTDFLPWMAVDQDTGTVAVAYYSNVGAPNNSEVNLRLAVSTNGGAGFPSKINVSSQRSRAASASYPGDFLEYIGLAVLHGTAHVFWADNRGASQGTFVSDLDAFAARVSFRSTSNTLTVTGDDAGVTDDTILVRSSPVNANFAEVFVNGALQWAGLWASIVSVVINGRGGDDTIHIEQVPAGKGVGVDGGAGSNVVALSPSALDLSNIQGLVGLTGTAGTYHLILNDQNFVGAVSYEVASIGVSWNYTGFVLFNFYTNNTESLTLNAGSGGNTMHVTGTEARTATAINAGAGDDIIKLSPRSVAGPLRIDGEAGSNWVDYTAYTIDVLVNLPLGQATDVSDGIFNIQNVAGGAGNDILVGDQFSNILLGNGGRDLLIAGGLDWDTGTYSYAPDSLFGGGGDDILIAGWTGYDLDVDTLGFIRDVWALPSFILYRVRALQEFLDPSHGGQAYSSYAGCLLLGEADNDWFFSNDLDFLGDLTQFEDSFRVEIF